MRRSLAYAKTVAERRQAGERVGLLVVSLHDWKAGTWFESRPEVCRVMLPADLSVGEADWSACLALDCLVCGAANDDVFYAACEALSRHGAASVWGEFDDGFWLLERGVKMWHAVDGPYALSKLGAAMRLHREVSMMLRRGFYASRVFDQARQAVLSSMTKVAA